MLKKTVDLRICNNGMSCEDYTLLVIAGPNNIPNGVRDMMEKHESACEYHRSSGFVQSAISTPVTPELEREAQELVRKFSKKN